MDLDKLKRAVVGLLLERSNCWTDKESNFFRKILGELFPGGPNGEGQEEFSRIEREFTGEDPPDVGIVRDFVARHI